MTTERSLITSEVDFDKDGRQTGFLRLPHSVHRSAYGWIPIPIVSIKNGEGPTILLMSGNHGDEYEGQVALSKLCRTLQSDRIQGRVVILPMANFPAARAGLRTSPIDDGNLNRSFPGDPVGGPTQMIAHYIETELMPRCDYAVDIHSGGSSLNYLPTALAARHDDPVQEAKIRALALSFGTPYCFVFPGGMGSFRTTTGAARRNNVIAMGTELGGVGTVSPAMLAYAEQGVRRVLVHCGMLSAEDAEPASGATRLMEATGMDYYVYAPDDGVFEPMADLGDEVAAESAAGIVHFLETPWLEPSPVQFNCTGMIICKRIPGRVMRGDCLYHLATDLAS